jgi:RNA polymerase sigma factor (sigma-70 family)
MTSDPRTDDELLRAPDPEAFAAFYRRHVDWVLGFLAHRTRDPELAADLAGEVFAAALLARERYRPRDGQANSWLFKIALNKLIDAQRRGAAEDRARRRLGMRRVVPDSDDLRHIDGLGEDVDVLALLDGLPGDQRRAITARVLEDRDYRDIARHEHVPEAVLRKRVSRGLSALRARIGART